MRSRIKELKLLPGYFKDRCVIRIGYAGTVCRTLSFTYSLWVLLFKIAVERLKCVSEKPQDGGLYGNQFNSSYDFICQLFLFNSIQVMTLFVNYYFYKICRELSRKISFYLNIQLFLKVCLHFDVQFLSIYVYL